MSKNRHKRSKACYEGTRFLAIPAVLLDSAAFLCLSSHAVKLFLDLGSQYRGDNNGDLCAAWKIMRKRGWRSESTLNNAKKELIATGLIAEARKGYRPNVCSLYALTFRPYNYNASKHDLPATVFPFGAWKRPIEEILSTHRPKARKIECLLRIATSTA